MEVWKDIEGYEGMYQVSDLGRVKSIGRLVDKGKKGFSFRKERILKERIPNGYSRVVLQKNTSKIERAIHRIVCKAFHPNPENKKFVNHKNGIKSDNRAVNVEWCTQSENEKHAYKLGLKNTKGEKHNQARLTESQVLEIRKVHQKTKLKVIGELYGISPDYASQVRNGKSWKHI